MRDCRPTHWLLSVCCVLSRRQVQKINGGEFNKLSTFPLPFLDVTIREVSTLCTPLSSEQRPFLIVINKRGNGPRDSEGVFPADDVFSCGPVRSSPNLRLPHQQLLVVIVAAR
ncbi:hypothetical protein JOB18_038202 [Solea senegalensis]|uniref:Secreted protein n=1 Tax=Solea senegalensis TaxID=28829 RepID=A0AAV6T108_SOLSE|nr:hypothetical protein JOB18_038202 [Solea senegalensis]